MPRTLGKISDIPDGEGRAFDVGGLRVAVFRTRGGGVFATQADCPHLGGPLADGLLDRGTVVCPLHDRTYDLRTGEGIGTDCRIRVFPARVSPDGSIVVDLERAVGEPAAS